MLTGNITRLHLKVRTLFHIHSFIKSLLKVVNFEISVKNYEEAGEYFFPLFLEGINYCMHYFMLFYFFTVTLDLKALCMQIVKLGDETFALGGRGIDIEFCFLCRA